MEVCEVEAFLLHDQDWQRLSMSQGTKGPRLFDWAAVPILHRWEDDGRHWLLLRRHLSDPREIAYYFVFAPPGTTLSQMVQAIGTRWHIEEDFEMTKDMGLDHYQLRCFVGCYRHITLVMLAHAYLAGICAQTTSSPPPVLCTPAPTALDVSSDGRPLLPLTVVSRASPAWTPHLACPFECEAGAGLVLVAPVSPQLCQLFPYETAFEGRLMASAGACWFPA